MSDLRLPRLNRLGPLAWLWTAALLSSAAASFGCGEQDGPELALPPEFVPIEGCEDHSYVGCDPLEESCREDVMGLVSCLRGNDATDLPPVRVITDAEFRQELERAAATDTEPGDPRYEDVMYWLGLLSASGTSDTGSIDARVRETRAYYSADTDDITLIQHADSTLAADTEAFTLTLAHETVHALQDLDLDLSAQADLHTYYDDVLAFRSMVEGEAMLYQNQISAAFWALSADEIHLDRRFEAWAALTDEDMVAAPAPLLESFFHFPYSYGARYVYGVYATGGSAAVRVLPAGAPRGTLSVFSPDRPPVEPAPWEEPLASPAGWDFLGDEALGAFMVFVFLERAGVADARTLAEAWRADRLYLFGTSTSTTDVVAAWRLRFAAGVDPLTAVQAFSAATYATTAQIEEYEGDVLVLLGDPAVLESWAPAITSPTGIGAGGSGSGG